MNETTVELRRRLENIETEAVEIRREINRRDREVITRLQTQLEQLGVRESIETVEAVSVQPEIPVLLRENRTLSRENTDRRTRVSSRLLIDHGVTTNLVDQEGKEILSVHTVQLLTKSSRKSPFRNDERAIAIGTTHFENRLWLGRVGNTREITDRDSRNVKVIRV